MTAHLRKVLFISATTLFISSIVLFILVLLQSSAMAWWEVGHQTIGLIADNHIKAQTRQRIKKILGRDYISLDQISTCADDIKHHSVNCASDFQLSKNPGSDNWHFIDIPLADKSPTAKSIQKYCENDNCLIGQIKNDIKILKKANTSQFEKETALMFLVHFMGDLHQPLHCINDKDSGGNKKHVWLYSTKTKKRMSLHSLWDNIIQEDIPDENIDSKTLAEILEKDISTKNTKLWLSGTPEDWALESYNIAKNVIYADYKTDNGHLGKDYQKKMQPIAYEQLEKGGLRLAKVLNDIFAKN